MSKIYVSIVLISCLFLAQACNPNVKESGEKNDSSEKEKPAKPNPICRDYQKLKIVSQAHVVDTCSWISEYDTFSLPWKDSDFIIQYELNVADPRERSGAARLLGDRMEPKAVPGLIQLLDDPNCNVRYYAAQALEKIADVSASEALLAQLNYEEDNGVRAALIGALGALGYAQAGPSIRAYLDPRVEVSSYIALESFLALGRIGDLEAVDPLILIMSCEDPKENGLSLLAARALGLIGDKKAIFHLAQMRGDEYDLARAHIALLTEGRPEVIEQSQAWLRDYQAWAPSYLYYGTGAFQRGPIILLKLYEKSSLSNPERQALILFLQDEVQSGFHRSYIHVQAGISRTILKLQEVE